METIEFYISVDSLPAYRELGAAPNGGYSYDILCMADVCKQTLQACNVEFRDPISGLAYTEATLAEVDVLKLQAYATQEAEFQWFGYVPLKAPKKAASVPTTGTLEQPTQPTLAELDIIVKKLMNAINSKQGA